MMYEEVGDDRIEWNFNNLIFPVNDSGIPPVDKILEEAAKNPELRKALKDVNKKTEKDDCVTEGPCKEQKDCCDPISCVQGECQMFHF